MTQAIISAVKGAASDLADEVVMAAAKARGLDDLTVEQARAAHNFNEQATSFFNQKGQSIKDPERFLPGGDLHNHPDRVYEGQLIQKLKDTSEYQEAVRLKLGEASIPKNLNQSLTNRRAVERAPTENDIQTLLNDKVTVTQTYPNALKIDGTAEGTSVSPQALKEAKAEMPQIDSKAAVVNDEGVKSLGPTEDGYHIRGYKHKLDKRDLDEVDIESARNRAELMEQLNENAPYDQDSFKQATTNQYAVPDRLPDEIVRAFSGLLEPSNNPMLILPEASYKQLAPEAPSISQPIIANQELTPVTAVESTPANTTDMGSSSANGFEQAAPNLPEAPAVNVTQSNQTLAVSPVEEVAEVPAVQAQPVATTQAQISAPVISQETVSASAAPALTEATPATTASAVEAPVVAQQSLTPQETQYAQSLEPVGAGAYEKKIGEAFGVPERHLDIFAREVNPTNFDKSGKNMLGQSLNETLFKYTELGAKGEPINRLLSNPVLDDASINAYKTKYDENIKAGLNPIAAAAHNQPAMVNKPHSSFAAALESDKGSIVKILGSGAIGAGLGYGLYDNPEEGFIMGVAGGAMGVGVKKAVGAYSDNIQAGMMKGLLKDNYKPGNTPDALNENFTAVANLNKEDLGFVDNYYKDTLTKNFGTASMGLQTRTMTLSGAALAGVAFTGNKKDKRRGFNANRGNRI